ncbi:MAG: hypothetical protein IJA45_01710 [Oscillospiraceae bacterium]|nr:hypothetical protein [Oscillospiraceae bacterium]
MTEATVNVSEIISSVSGMFGDFSVSNLLLFIGGGIALAAGLVLAWFGVRFLTRKLMAALKKGKL